MISLTQVLSLAFVMYILYSIWSLYSVLQTRPCEQSVDTFCLEPYLNRDPLLKLSVYASVKKQFKQSNSYLIWKSEGFFANSSFEKMVYVKIPPESRNNGSLYAHVDLRRYDGNDQHSTWSVKKSSRLTTFAIPQAATFQLVGSDNQSRSVSQPESHWNSKFLINIVDEAVTIDKYHLVPEVANHLVLISSNEYLPILFIDEVSIRLKDLMPLNESCNELPLRIIYEPISMGKLKFWSNMQQSLSFFSKIGFSQKDIDEVKNIFVDVNLYLLLLTFLVSAFHLLFDFLAFKNDIHFWRQRKNMVGLSTRTLVWRCFSTFIIFLYLLDEQTSMLVLLPSGIGLLIEIWKLLKAFKITFKWSNWKPKIEFGSRDDNEADTEAFDAQAMKWLFYVLHPLIAFGAIYSLLYTPHKSWYSWTIQSLANA